TTSDSSHCLRPSETIRSTERRSPIRVRSCRMASGQPHLAPMASGAQRRRARRTMRPRLSRRSTVESAITSPDYATTESALLLIIIALLILIIALLVLACGDLLIVVLLVLAQH